MKILGTMKKITTTVKLCNGDEMLQSSIFTFFKINLGPGGMPNFPKLNILFSGIVLLKLYMRNLI